MKVIGKKQKIIDPKKVIYGTARFGDFEYGNGSSKPDSHQQIIETILDLGIRRIDTATRYGSAEKILGNFSYLFPTDFIFDTKIDNVNINSKNLYEDVKLKVGRSLDKMKITNLGTLYIHENELEIISNPYLIESLEKLKNLFPIDKIGASIYSTNELEFCLVEELIETIQMPINLISRCFLNRIKETNISKKEIIARSILLQGILASPNFEYIESINKELYKAIGKVNKVCNKYDSSLLNEAFRFIDQTGLKFIIGSVSKKNIFNGLEYKLNSAVNMIEKELSEFIDNSFTYTNPRNW